MTELEQARLCLLRFANILQTRPPTETESCQVEYIARLTQRLYANVYSHNPEAVGTSHDFGDVDGVKK